MRVGHWIALIVVAYVAFALFGRAGGQATGSLGVSSPPVAGSLTNSACIGPPPLEIGPPRLIPGFDMNSLPVGQVVGLAPEELRIREVLNRPAEFALVDVPLNQFVAQLTEKYKLPVLIDAPALRKQNLDLDAPLTVTVRSSRLRVALREVLGRISLGFAIRDELVIITSKDAVDSITPTRTYQVHDLIITPNDPANSLDFDSLIELLTSTLAPETWRESGGSQGVVNAYKGPGSLILVITHTEEIHERIERLFADLRAARLPEIYRLQQQRMRRAYVPHPFYIRD